MSQTTAAGARTAFPLAYSTWEVGFTHGLDRTYRVTLADNGQRLVEISIAETYSPKAASGARRYHYRILRQYTRGGNVSRAWEKAIEAAERCAAIAKAEGGAA